MVGFAPFAEQHIKILNPKLMKKFLTKKKIINPKINFTWYNNKSENPKILT